MGDRMRHWLGKLESEHTAWAWLDRWQRSILSVRLQLEGGTRLVEVLKFAEKEALT